MHEKKLIVEFDFEDKEEGFEFRVHTIGQFTSEDGNSLNYKEISSEAMVYSWDDYTEEAFNETLTCFEEFVSDENECEWTKKEFITRPARAGCLQNINYYDNLCGMIIVYTYQY